LSVALFWLPWGEQLFSTLPFCHALHSWRLLLLLPHIGPSQWSQVTVDQNLWNYKPK
jgi:hypothetical protein